MSQESTTQETPTPTHATTSSPGANAVLSPDRCKEPNTECGYISQHDWAYQPLASLTCVVCARCGPTIGPTTKWHRFARRYFFYSFIASIRPIA
eukprot:9466521-Pyramimonas_sp.AAC.1